MTEPMPTFGSEKTTFQCWKNLATGKYQWMTTTGELHGPLHNSESEARQWFDSHGGLRALSAERQSRLPERVKDLLAISAANKP
jgi:hypothetical protein